LSGGQGYFHREAAKKSDFKNFAFFAVGFLGLRLGCTVFTCGFSPPIVT